MRFRVYFKSIERLGGKNDAYITRFSESAEHEVIAHLVSKLSAPQQAYDLPEDEQYVCYAAKPTSLMIRADGSLGKCTVALYDTRNSLGHILPDGTLEVDVSELRLWAWSFASLNPDELACPYSVVNGEASPMLLRLMGAWLPRLSSSRLGVNRPLPIEFTLCPV